jgi:glycerophosphoryl diester phosphodiesterase
MIILRRTNGRLEESEFLLVSHRGGRGFGPENTLQSLRQALDFGVEMVECDVRMSSDGVAVIHHGPFLGYHILGRLSLREIRERAPHVPTLREFLETAGDRCALNLEIKKCDPLVLAETLRETPPAYTPLVTSFDVDFLAAFRETACPTEIGVLSQFDPAADRVLRMARRCGASAVLPVCFSVDGELVSRAHARGLRVITWTVNSTGNLEELVACGVDGVITDAYPELKAFLEESFGEEAPRFPVQARQHGSSRPGGPAAFRVGRWTLDP